MSEDMWLAFYHLPLGSFIRFLLLWPSDPSRGDLIDFRLMWAQFEHLHPAPPPPQPNPGPTGACRAENKQRVTHKLAHTHTQKPPITSKHIIYWGCLATKRRHTHHNIMANLYPAVSATGRQTWRAISLALVSGAKKSPSNKKLVLIHCKQKAIDWNQCIKV